MRGTGAPVWLAKEQEQEQEQEPREKEKVKRARAGRTSSSPFVYLPELMFVPKTTKNNVTHWSTG